MSARHPKGSPSGGRFRAASKTADLPAVGRPLSPARPAAGGGLALAADDQSLQPGHASVDNLQAAEQSAAAEVEEAEKALLAARWGTEQQGAAQAALSEARDKWAAAHVAVRREALSEAERRHGELREETARVVILDKSDLARREEIADAASAAYVAKLRAKRALEEAERRQPWRKTCPHAQRECHHCKYTREAQEARQNHPELAAEEITLNRPEWAGAKP